MNRSKIAVLCLLTSVLWQGACAQWIIDGQQVQTLNLNVSDPQALYTDGSREMTAPLVFSDACSAPTSSIFQITVPWLGGVKEFFVFDASYEYLKLCDGPLNLQVDGLVLSSAGIYSMEFPGRLNFEEGILEFGDEASISTEEGTLDGNWYVTGVAEDSSSIINRGYADTRYLRAGQNLTAPLSFSSTSTSTSGLFRAYNEWNGAYEDLLIYDADNEVLKLGALTTALKIGGLRIRQHDITDLEAGNIYISFEEGLLGGGNWAVSSDPVDNGGIVSRGYADTRYLRRDIQQTQALDFASSLTATNGALQIYASDSAENLGYFKTLDFQDGLQFSTAHSASLFFGQNSSDGLLIGPDSIMQLGYNTRIEFETGLLTGSGAAKWHVAADPTENSGIVSKGYADGRYLQRTEGITTNHTFQAGDTLVISNGLITAILP